MKNKTIKNEEIQLSLVQGSSQPILDLLKLNVKSNGKFVKYGEDNLVPLKLWNTYLNNAILFGIINGTKDLVLEGLTSDYNYINEDGDTFIEIIEKIVKDYLIYGGFAIEVILNKGGEVAQYIYTDFKSVRVNEDMDTAFIANKWGKFTTDYVELPIWNKDIKEKHYLIYVNGNITDSFYPVPLWCGAILSADILNRVHQFHSTSVDNNFNVSAIINFNNGTISSTQKQIIEDKLKEKFCGSANGSTLMTSFNEDKDHAVTIEKLDADNWADKYNSLITYCIDDIFASFRATPQLFGIKTGQNTAFNKEEFNEALALYNKQQIIPIRSYIKKQIYKTTGITINFNGNE